MQRSLIGGLLLLSLSCVSCTRDSDVGTATADSTASNKSIEVTGCLTANRATNQFVVTADRTALGYAARVGEAETYAYQLVGGLNLHQHIGRQVVVKGTVSGDIEKSEYTADKKTEQPQVRSRGEDVTPAVESEEEIELKVQRLHVASITPTGSVCQAGSSQ